MASINNTATILSNNAAQYQNANSRIFDAISQAAAAYEEQQKQREANLAAERKAAQEALYKAASEQMAIKLDPEKTIMQLQTKAAISGLTPEEQVQLNTAKQFLSSKVLVDKDGIAYQPYNFSNMGGISPVGQAMGMQPQATQASPVAQVMGMQSNVAPSQSSNDILLPPPSYGGKGDMSLFEEKAPPPLGQAAPKVSAIAQVKPPKMVQGAGRMVPDPIDQKRYEAELAAAKEIDVTSAKTEQDKRAAKFNDTKSFNGLLGDITNLNSKVDAAIKLSSKFNTGALAGEGGKGILGSGNITGGVDLAETLKTIESDSALGKLAEMKQQSATGASGLGAASEKEIGLLMAARQSVAQSQTESQLDANLREYKKIRTQVLKNMAEAYKSQYGEYPEGYDPKKFETDGGPEKPKVGQIIDGYRYIGGDPAKETSYRKVQ